MFYCIHEIINAISNWTYDRYWKWRLQICAKYILEKAKRACSSAILNFNATGERYLLKYEYHVV